MIGIYKITNKINNHCYVGQSVNIKHRWEEEKKNAFSSASKEYDCYRSRAFRKYGLDNFTFEVLEECSIEQLNEKEIYWIKYYNSFLDGYNETIGGQGRPNSVVKITQEKLYNIYIDLKEYKLTQNEIAKKYNVSYQMISNINTGKTRISEEIDYPIRKVNIQKYNAQFKNSLKEKTIKNKIIHYCKICGKPISEDATYCKDCYNELQRRVERPDKDTLLQEIATSSFVQVGNKYGVSDNTIRKWCKAYGLPIHKKDIVNLYQENISH